MYITQHLNLSSGCFFVLISLLTIPAFAQEERPQVPGGMYDKPYIEKFGEGTAVGGYIDMEWEITDTKNTFDQHRLIPFIFSEISPQIHFATEIEFEHGGRVPGDGEVKLEYAALDLRFTDWLTYRSGVILSPLGKFNLVHDSPWNDFVSRPLVNRQLIPTTLSEAGMGFHGTFYPSDISVLGYEVYVVNGFNEEIIPTINSVRIREGRGSLKEDNNTKKSVVGRVVFSPFLGTELGSSIHTGAYSDDGKQNLSIAAFDLTFQKGPFELLTEAAYSVTEITNSKSISQGGYYFQPNYHFGFGMIPGFPRSRFTAMVRLGNVEFNRETPGATATRYSVGLNWRPVEDTAIKVEYQTQQSTPAGTTEPGESQGTFFLGTTSYF